MGHYKNYYFLNELLQTINRIRVEKVNVETYIIFASNHNELLIFPLGLRRQFQAVFAHAWNATHTQQTVELLHAQRLTFLAASRSFQRKLSSKTKSYQLKPITLSTGIKIRYKILIRQAVIHKLHLYTCPTSLYNRAGRR